MPRTPCGLQALFNLYGTTNGPAALAGRRQELATNAPRSLRLLVSVHSSHIWGPISMVCGWRARYIYGSVFLQIGRGLRHGLVRKEFG